MTKKDLIENTPLRIITQDDKGNFIPRRMGLVMARAGLGKTAVLVQSQTTETQWSILCSDRNGAEVLVVGVRKWIDIDDVDVSLVGVRNVHIMADRVDDRVEKPTTRGPFLKGDVLHALKVRIEIHLPQPVGIDQGDRGLALVDHIGP